MILYIVADRTTGRVLSLHHEVDADGRDARCRDEDVLATLPPSIDRDGVTVLSTQLDGMPSGRDATFMVDVQRRTVALQPVGKREESAGPPGKQPGPESGGYTDRSSEQQAR